MKKLLPVLPILVLILSGCQTTGHQWNTHGKPIHTDDDWNLTFYENCSLPKMDSLQWIKEGKNKFIRFRLDDKHYGGCSTDRRARHSAPYWERAEVKQTNSLQRNTRYELKFKVRFVAGFAGAREDFWQMHASTSSSCHHPPLMTKFHFGELMMALSRNKKGSTSDGAGHTPHYSSKQPNAKAVRISTLIGKWYTVRYKFDTSEYPEVSLYLNDDVIFSEIPYQISRCGIPHFKFGIYRPGNTLKKNNLSIVDFDKIQLTVLEENIKEHRNTFCLNANATDSKISVYRVSDNCAEGHDPVSHQQYNKIKKLMEEWKKEDGSKQQSN